MKVKSIALLRFSEPTTSKSILPSMEVKSNKMEILGLGTSRSSFYTSDGKWDFLIIQTNKSI